MLKNLIRILIVLGTIASTCLVARKAFKKYLPVTLFSTIIQLVEIFYYTTYKKWQVKGRPGALICDTLILVTGPYVIATLLSFQYSKGNFMKYLLINTITGFLYAFPIIRLLKRFNFFKLRLTSMRIFLLTVTNSLLNYLFHSYYERLQTNDKH